MSQNPQEIANREMFRLWLMEQDAQWKQRMGQIILKLKLLDDAQKYYESIPRWRIFKRNFAKEIWRSTILMVAEME